MIDRATVATIDSAAHPGPPAGDSEAARLARVAWFGERFAALQGEVGRAVIGKPDVVRLALTCLLAGGHLLIDDVPGVGKTSLARAIAEAAAGTVHRIQGTTDLLPGDITGTEVWNPARLTFEHRPGPVFANVVIVDEINRMPTRSQSALLEVMEEGHVSVAGRPVPVPTPFFVVATQNPVEYESTYDLPEAQLDRFLMRIAVGYPGTDDEIDVALRQAAGGAHRPVAVADPATLTAMIGVRREVHVSRPLARYCVELCAATRQLPRLHLGAGPRGSGALVAAAQAWAGADHRSFATPDDVRAVAPHVLTHRLLLRADADYGDQTAASLVQRVLDTVPAPLDRPAPGPRSR
jgi:MoxR-like ATPase